MDTLRSVFDTLTAASLLLAGVQVYLTLNKLWKRKHERVVAESISIAGETIGLVPLVLLSITFFLDRQWLGLADAVLWLAAAAVTISIGAGVWVAGRRKRGFLDLVREALRAERKEVGYLARSLLRPSGADRIMKILSHVAMLDDRLDDRERAFVEEFAEAWGVEFAQDDLRANGEQGATDPVRLRTEVAAYLETSPPDAQVRQFGDVLRALVEVDEEVSPEETLLMDEVEGMFAAYLGGGGGENAFAVALVPQSEAQDGAIATLLPGVTKQQVHGGVAYVTGYYHSERFANLVGEEYRALGFFTTVVPAVATPEQFARGSASRPPPV